MKSLTLGAACFWALMAAAPARADSGSSDSLALDVALEAGSRLSVSQAITIPAQQNDVVFQGGKPVTLVDPAQPYCFLIAWKRATAARQLQAGASLAVTLTSSSIGDYKGIALHTSRDATIDIVSCFRWGSYPTLGDLKSAFGTYLTLKPASGAGQSRAAVVGDARDPKRPDPEHPYADDPGYQPLYVPVVDPATQTGAAPSDRSGLCPDCPRHRRHRLSAAR